MASPTEKHAQWVHDQVAPVLATVKAGEAQLHPHEAVWQRIEAHAAQRLAERDASRRK